jgi:hypothetical protein
VHWYGVPVDMRKSFDGLSALPRDVMKLDPFSGQLLVFSNRRATRTVLETAVGRGRASGCGGAGQGAARRNSSSIPTSPR